MNSLTDLSSADPWDVLEIYARLHTQMHLWESQVISWGAQPVQLVMLGHPCEWQEIAQVVLNMVSQGRLGAGSNPI